MEIDLNHHAFLLQADSIAASRLPEELLTQAVDIQHVVLDSFGIDEARELTAQASQRSVSGDGRSFLMCVKNLTSQAQNALLKLFEEPPEKVKFFLLVPNPELIIPTLRSRLQLINTKSGGSQSEVIEEFRKLSMGGRMELIAVKTKEKDLVWINSLVNSFLHYAEQEKNKQMLSSAVFVASKINGPGAAKKMLLEELALSLT